MSGISQYWRYSCSSFVVGSVLIAFLQESVFAQKITADNTLPNNSIVTPDGNIFNIICKQRYKNFSKGEAISLI